MQESILIIDFGSQVTQLIARRLRAVGVFCEIQHYGISADHIKAINPVGIILSGGPNSVYQDNAPALPTAIFSLNIPILGICYGMQLIAKHFGGTIRATELREFGSTVLHHCHSPIFAHIGRDHELTVWMSHCDEVVTLPPDFVTISSSTNCPIAAMANISKKIYAVQFHPEVTHTQSGNKILENFALKICSCQANWHPTNYVGTIIDRIKHQVGQDKVLLGLSGGVDSTVTAVLIHQAIGSALHCVFIDNGLLRANEAAEVMQNYLNLGLNIIKVDASVQFYTALAGIIEPEQKRKIIGKVFVELFQQEAAKIAGIAWLAQGTIYPDVIESTHNGMAAIKSHHNVGGLPATLALKLLEPLRILFKDEVRKLGYQLNIDSKLLERHPFPGPGLAIRIIGEIKHEYLDILQQADAIFLAELYKHNYYQRCSQAFAVFLPIKSVGVKGDARTYSYVIALRAIQSTDFMSAQAMEFPFSFITHVANRITNEVPGISRVVYDISSKPPATIEWE
jgi:GMP synthase (glutamine-hydrolysing)